MKLFFVCLALLLAGCQGKVEVIEKSITTFETCRVEQYDMKLKLDTELNRLSGNVIMHIVNDTQKTLHELCIRHYADSYIKEFNAGETKIENASIVDSNTDLNMTVMEDASVVYLDLGDNPLEPNEKVSISLNYYTDIPNTLARFAYWKNDLGTVYQLSFCFPTLAMYKDGVWNENPTITLLGETNFQKMTNYNVDIEVPEGYLVAAVGEEATNGVITHIEATNVRQMAIVASDYMGVDTQITDNGITINNYYLQNENATNYRYYQMQSAIDAVELFTEKIGKYPYQELDVMQSLIGGGMEYPGLVMIGCDLKSVEEDCLDDATEFPELCRVVAHEVGHQWFYCGVGSDPFDEAWLDEGLTSFCEELYMRSNAKSISEATQLAQDRYYYTGISSYSNEEYEDYVKFEISNYVGDETVINKAYNEFTNNSIQNSYTITVYDAGKYFMIELRDAMGEDAFYTMLQDYYSSYYLKESTTKDLLNIIRHHNNSRKINKLIEKYIQE